jgi:hypothetical protein
MNVLFIAPFVLGSKALSSFRTHVAVIGQVDQERVKILPEFHEEKTSPQRKQKATPHTATPVGRFRWQRDCERDVSSESFRVPYPTPYNR